MQGLIESALAEDARAAGAAHRIEIAMDPEPDRNSFIRTDQYSFVQAGVPTLAMKFAGMPTPRTTKPGGNGSRSATTPWKTISPGP